MRDGRTGFICALALIAAGTPALGQEVAEMQAPAPAEATSQDEADEADEAEEPLICRNIPRPASRLPRRNRVCMTARDWDLQEQAYQEEGRRLVNGTKSVLIRPGDQ